METALNGSWDANSCFLKLPTPQAIDLMDINTLFFALFNQINRSSIEPIETTTPSNPPEQRP
jgi:hypothetical protein